MKMLKLLAMSLALSGSATTAQVRVPAPPPTLQAQFTAQVGSDAVYFGPNGHLLSPQARAILSAQAMYLNTHPHVRARVAGHSDERGTREHSIGISERRAAAVRNYLVSLGVEPARLTLIAWGKERPAGGAVGPAATALNRRVQTIIEP